MGNGICRCSHNFPFFLHIFFFCGIRKDKKLYKPETIKKWAIVIFESNRFFNDKTVADMISGFIQGARSVGKSSVTLLYFIIKSRVGMTVGDTNPLVRYAHGHTNIIKVSHQIVLFHPELFFFVELDRRRERGV